MEMELFEEFQYLLIKFLGIADQKKVSRINKSWNQQVTDSWIRVTRLSGQSIRHLFEHISQMDQQSQIDLFLKIIKQMPNLNMITSSAIPKNIFHGFMIQLPEVTVEIVDFNWKLRNYNFLYYLLKMNNDSRDPYFEDYLSLPYVQDRIIKVWDTCMQKIPNCIVDEEDKEIKEMSEVMLQYMRARERRGFQIVKSLNVMFYHYNYWQIMDLEFQEYDRSYAGVGDVHHTKLSLSDIVIDNVNDLENMKDKECFKCLKFSISNWDASLDQEITEQNIFLRKLSSILINVSELHITAFTDRLSDICDWISQFEKLEKAVLVFHFFERYRKFTSSTLLPMVNYLTVRNHQVVDFECRISFFKTLDDESVIERINNYQDEAMSEIIKIKFPKIKNFYFHRLMYSKELLYVRRFKHPMWQLFEMFPKFRYLDIGAAIGEDLWRQDFEQFAADHKNRMFKVNHSQVVLLGDNYQVGHLLFSPIALLIHFLI